MSDSAAVNLRSRIYSSEQSIEDLTDEIRILKEQRQRVLDARGVAAEQHTVFEDSILSERIRAAEIRDISNIRLASSYSESMGKLLSGNEYTFASSSFDLIDTTLRDESVKLMGEIEEKENRINELRNQISLLRRQIALL